MPASLLMTPTPYILSLSGLDAPPASIGMMELEELCRAVRESAERALRLQVEGTSTRKGRTPDWLREATAFRVRPFQAGSTLVPFSAPPLSETPLFSGDGLPAGDVLPEKTALSYLADAVQDLAAGHSDSDRLDRGVLDALERFGKIGGSEVEITLSSEARPADRFTITRTLTATVARLKRETPRDATALLAGRLDTIEHDAARFTLVTDAGLRVKGSLASDDATERLRGLWGQQIIAQGTARHTATGRVRFLDADTLRAREEGDDVMLTLAQTPALFPASPEAAKNGWETLHDAWPGEETWDELLDAMSASGEDR